MLLNKKNQHPILKCMIQAAREWEWYPDFSTMSRGHNGQTGRGVHVFTVYQQGKVICNTRQEFILEELREMIANQGCTVHAFKWEHSYHRRTREPQTVLHAFCGARN